MFVVSGFFFLSVKVAGRMEDLKYEILSTIEKQIGKRINYEKISPSTFRYVEVKNLVVFEKDRALLRINKIKVYYSVFKLLKTHNILASIENINLSNSSFELDLDKDVEILNILKNIFITKGDEKNAYFSLPKVSGSNISLRLTRGSDLIVLDNLFYEISKGESALDLNLRGRVILGYNFGKKSEALNLNSRVKIRGLIGSDLKWGELKLRFLSLSSNLFTVSRQTFQLSLKNNKLSLQKIQDKNPLDFVFMFDGNKNVITLNFKSENLLPSSVVKFKGKLKDINKWLSSSLTTNSSFSINLSTGSIAYNSSFSADVGGVKRGFKYVPSFRIVSHLYGDAERVHFTPLDIYSKMGNMRFKGNVLLKNLFPSGLIKLSNIKIPQSKNLEAVISVKRSKRELVLTSEEFAIGELSFDSFNLSLLPDLKCVVFNMESHVRNRFLSGDFDTGEKLPGGIVSSAGKLYLKPKLRLSFSVKTENVSPEHLLLAYSGKLDLPEEVEYFLKNFELTLNMDVETDFTDWKVTVKQASFKSIANSGEYLDLVLSYENKTFVIHRMEGLYKKVKFDGGLSFDFSAKDKVDFDSSFSINDKLYSFKGRFIPRLGVLIQGKYGFYFSLFYQAGKIVSFDFRVKNFPIPLIKDNDVTLSGSFLGEYKGRKDWYIKTKDLLLHNVNILQSKKNTIKLSFVLQNEKLTLENVLYKDEFSSVTGNGNFELALDYMSIEKSIATGWVFLQNPTTRETYRIHITKKKDVDFTLFFSDSPLERIGKFSITGNVAGSLSVQSLFTNVQGIVVLSLEKGKLNADPISLGLELNYSKDRMVFKSVNVKYLTHRITEGNGKIDIKNGEFSFIADYSADYTGNQVNLILFVEAKLSKRFNMKAPVNIFKGIFNQDFVGNINLSSIKVNGDNYDPWGFHFNMANGVLNFGGGPNNTIFGVVRDSGDFRVNLLKPLAVEGELAGKINNNRINANFDVRRFNLTVLNFLIKSKIINFQTGYAKGKVSIEGPFNDPDFLGVLDVIDGEARSSLSPFSVKPINTKLVYQGKAFLLNKIITKVGKKDFNVSGKFFIDHWIPDAFDIYFDSPDKTGIRFVHKFGPLLVDGYASGKIRVRGDPVEIIIEGDVVANYSKIALGEVNKKEESKGGILTKVNLNITTGKRVVFFWPSFNFPILRAYTDIGDTVHVIYNEGDRSYKIKGDIGIQGGEVFYFDRSFYLKEGSISFNENQDKFDPFAYVLAEIREQDEKGELVTIYLEVKNNLSRFSPRFYSEPPRSDVDILSMIGGSIFEKVQKRGLGLSAVVVTSELVSQFGILRPFESAVREFLGLDLFSIRTQILQNLILEKILGNPTNPLDNTTVSLGKYLGNNLFLEMLIRFRRTGFNNSGVNYFTGLTSDLELNFEWTTPFFLMEWSFSPQHPEYLFLNDNSLTLKWKYSY